MRIFASKCASRHNGVHFCDISTSKSGLRMVFFATFHFKCASHHNGVQLFMSHLPRHLQAHHFSEPTFRPSGATKHWKNTVYRDFPAFSCTCIFSRLPFSISDLLTSDLLHVRAASWLCFSSIHIVGSFTSKLPSVKMYLSIYIYIYFNVRIYLYMYMCAEENLYI